MTRHRQAVIALLGAAGVLFAGVSFVAYRFVVRAGPDEPLFQLSESPRYEWKSVDKKHWQAIATDTTLQEEAAATDTREGDRGACTEGMIEVAGRSLLDPNGRASSDEIEAMQNKTCTNWLNTDFPARCQTFDRDAWLKATSELPRQAMHYCIDRFEYPNARGENPIIVVTYQEAAGMCKSSGKRLCSETEWTFACEGEEGAPYPEGYERDAEACVIDRTWRAFTEGALQPRDGPIARAELDRLWQGEPSGSHPKCRSPFGVYDMTGNVDEWTHTVRSEGYASVLKGGYWGPVRARCRPSTRAHNETFIAYQQGFRCCTDAPEGNAGAATISAVSDDAGTIVASTDAGMNATIDAGVIDAGKPAPAISSPPPIALDTHSHVKDHGQPVAAGGVVPVEYSDEAESLAKRVGVSCAIGPHGDTRIAFALGGIALLAGARRRKRERRDS